MISETAMKSITDEIIMAYVDGQLDPEQTILVKEAIAHDPALREKAAVFNDTASVLEGVFDAPLHEEIPTRLLKTVQVSSKKSFVAQVGKFFSGLQPVPAYAFALVLLVGVGILYKTQTVPTAPGVAPLLATREFSRLLDQTPSGQSFVVQKSSSAVTIVPILSFRDADQRFCRQLELDTTSAKTQKIGQGIVCRTAAGDWETVALLENTAQEGMQQASPQRYELAGDTDKIDAMVDSMLNGKPISLQQENEYILNGWKIRSGK
jgi:hypothetical protein